MLSLRSAESSQDSKCCTRQYCIGRVRVGKGPRNLGHRLLRTSRPILLWRLPRVPRSRTSGTRFAQVSPKPEGSPRKDGLQLSGIKTMRVMVMNWDQVKGNWKEFQGKVKEK